MTGWDRHDPPEEPEGSFVWLAVAALAAIAGWGALWCAVDADAARGRVDPTIRPAFVATCVQGAVCAAPAVIYLDARETTAEGEARPFHALAYSWDCDGAPASNGPLSACVFDRPGDYAVTLRVEREGEAALTAQRVTVLDRSAVRVIELAAGSRVASVALGTGPVLLTTRAGGPPAVVTGALSPPDGTTVAGVDFEGGCVQIAPERSRPHAGALRAS